MNTGLAQLARGVADVLFPPVCVHCRGLVEIPAEPSADAAAGAADVSPFRHLCGKCAAQIDWVRAPHCATCGHPFYGDVEGRRMCPHCEGLEPVFGEGRTATLFKGPVRALVIELKYHRGRYVLEDMERIFRRARELIDFVRGATLVPVPLHPVKERHRGYNQAALIAAALARAANSPGAAPGVAATRVVPLLRRRLNTATQTAFDRRSRMANLKNAFALARGAALIRDCHYILVDDVFTTGSTLNSCARTLRRAGALKLDVLTLGHG